jgi:hypothetical protein
MSDPASEFSGATGFEPENFGFRSTRTPNPRSSEHGPFAALFASLVEKIEWADFFLMKR